jgi:hypothetical protein
MPRISAQEFERLPLRVHDFLAGVPLHDVWAVDLPQVRAGITLNEFLNSASEPLRCSLAVRALVNVRFALGRVFGWDRKPGARDIDTFASRLTTSDRAKTLTAPGRPEGSSASCTASRMSSSSKSLTGLPTPERSVPSSRGTGFTASILVCTCNRSADSPGFTWL